jgi:hypothetical protein
MSLRAAVIARVAVALAAAVSLAAPPAKADGGDWEVIVGFDGRYRAGSWTPLLVSPAAAASQSAVAGTAVHAWVEDPDGVLVRSPPALLETAPGGRTAALFRVRPGRPAARLVIEHGSPPRRTETRLPEAVPSTHAVLLVLGDLPAAGRAARLLGGGDGPRMDVVKIGGPEQGGFAACAAGSSGRDYDSADLVVVCGRAAVDAPQEVLAGLDDWVRRGGRLLFVAGESAREVQARDGPAAGWLPGPIATVAPLRRLGAIESHARTAGLAARAANTVPQVAVLAVRGSVPGVVEVFEGSSAADLPLVVRRAHGLGTITWLAVDADAEPLRGWSGSDTLLVRLLGGRPRDVEPVRPVAAAGPPDLAGQLRVALESPADVPDTAAGRGPVPFAVILGLGLLYVACLYPLDWWLVSRGRAAGGRDRSALAWLTLPAIALAFTAAAWGVADHWRPAAQRLARAAEIVDVDALDGAVRGAGWAMDWRADNTLATVAVSPPGQGGEAAVSWCADAGTGFGAVDAVVTHPPLAAADYAYGDSLATLEHVPVAAASDRVFEADWSTRVDPGSVATSSLVEDAQGTLRGSIAHHLPFPLDDCRLAHGGWVYDIGRLEPGVPHDVESGRGPRSLAGALTLRTVDRDREVVGRWDAMGTDLARILLVAGFHAAAGGAPYTGLEAGRLGRLDLSPLLAVDRAVLFGTAAGAAPDWTASWSLGSADAAAAHPTVAARLYRIVIPLGPAARAPGAGRRESP